MYYYILEEYKVSNELLTEDIYVRVLSVCRDTSCCRGAGPRFLADPFFMLATQALQAAVQRIHTYVQGLEEKVTLLEQKRR